MTSVNNQPPGGFPDNYNVSGGTTTHTQGTQGTQSTKTTSPFIKDLVQNWEGSPVEDQYTNDPNKPGLSKPSKMMADGTVDPHKEANFKLPYGKPQSNFILKQFGQTLESNLEKSVNALGLSPEESKAMLASLKQAYIAISKGETPELPPAQLALLKQAENATTTTIKEKYGLPPTWSPQSKSAADWTPVKGTDPSVIDPAKFMTEFINNGLEEFSKLLDQMQKGVQKLIDALPPNDPNAVTMRSFLKAISDAIQKLKEFLFKKQEMDSTAEQGMVQGKMDMVNTQSDIRNKQMDKMEEAAAKKRQMGDFGIAMKVIGPALSAALMVAGVALLAAAGAGAILIAISLIIGTAVMAYTVIDACTDCSAKLFDVINTALRNAISKSGGDPDWAYAVEAAIVLVMLAPMVVILLCAPGLGTTGAMEVTKQSASQVIRLAIMEFIRQATAQVAMMLTMQTLSSAVLPAMKPMVHAMCKDSKVPIDEDALTIFLQIFMTMLVVVTCMGIGGRVGSSTQKTQVKFDSFSKNAKMLSEAQKGLAELKSIENPSADQLQLIGKYNKELEDITSDSSFIQGFANLLTTGIGKGSPKGESMMNNVAHIASIVGGVLEGVSVGVGVGSSIVEAVNHLQMAAILKDKGDLDAAESEIENFLQILENVLKKMQNNLLKEGQFANSLTNTQKQMYQGASQGISQLFSQQA